MAESDDLRQRRRAFADAMAGLRLNPRDLARGSAAVSSLRVPMDEVVPGLIETLGAPDADLRSLAAQLLRLQGDAAAVPSLLAAMPRSVVEAGLSDASCTLEAMPRAILELL